MTRPDSLFEAASYDLNKFIERRIAERRAMQRDSSDRRKSPEKQDAHQENTASDPASMPQSSPSH